MIIFFLALNFLFATSPNVSEILNILEKDSFHYAGQMKLFSYYSTESCLYVGTSSLIIQNYCSPQNPNHPARSYTLISYKFGVIDIYEENRGNFYRRNITLNTFIEDMVLDFPEDLASMSIEEVNQSLETNYYRYARACWALTQSQREPSEQMACYKANPDDYKSWLKEAFYYTSNRGEWNKIFDRLEAAR